MPSLLEVRVDPAQLERVANLIGALGKNAGPAITRAINHTGDVAKTQMIRTLTTQTGLRRQTIVKALRVTAAATAGGAYTIRSRGGDISLKYFGARETRAGVSAAPFGQRRIFAGSFIKGGRFPNRVALSKGNGQVFQRAGSSRLPITKLDSGVFIPKEMTEGATAAVFQATVAARLPDRLAHEMLRAIGG